MRRFPIILVIFSMLSSGCLGWAETGPDFYGEVLTDSPVPIFELQSHDGTTFNSSILEGKVVIVVFVYTRCPDICPVTSQNVPVSNAPSTVLYSMVKLLILKILKIN